MTELLRIENLTKEYKVKKDSLFEKTRYFKALDDVSLTVNRNEIFARKSGAADSGFFVCR